MKDGGHAECFLDMLEGFVGIGAPGQRLGLVMQHGGEGGAVSRLNWRMKL